jgi:DNA-binding response OmpR family regulator
MKKHILLIDDDSDELVIFCEAMKDTGIENKITWAESVDHALKMLMYIQPDIIFIDYNMPGDDGLTGIMQIRELTTCDQVPVILYSTCVAGSNTVNAMKVGATACIRKPSHLQELSDALVTLFDCLSAEGEARQCLRRRRYIRSANHRIIGGAGHADA